MRIMENIKSLGVWKIEGRTLGAVHAFKEMKLVSCHFLSFTDQDT